MRDQPTLAMRTGMRHYIFLQDAAVDRPAQHAAQDISKGLRDGIHAVHFIGMRADERWC